MWRKVGVFAAISGHFPGSGDDEAKPTRSGSAVLIPVRSFPSSCGNWVGPLARTPKLSRPLRGRPLAFLYSYIRRHPAGHLTVLLSVLVAVTCSVSTQYGMKYLIDIVATGREAAGDKVWGAFALLCGLVAADNLFWRVGGYAAHRTFVAVTGDIRRDLFRYLAGHAPTYFAERLPGALASRITSTANAAFTVENTTAWNVLPPSVAVVLAIAFIGSVNLALAGTLLGIALMLGALIFHLARQGAQRHREYAREAAAVDGELVDIIGNFNVVRAFGATFREQRRIDERMGTEMAAAPAQPVLSGTYQAGACDPDRVPDRRRGRMGHHPVAERPGEGRRPRADHFAGVRYPAWHARPRGCPGRSDATYRPVGGSHLHPADAARVEGSARMRGRCRQDPAKWHSSRSASPIPAAPPY